MKIDKISSYKNTAYHYDYLQGVMNLTKLVFVMFNENNNLDIYDQIDAYFQTSDIREKMDKGNWSALMKGSKQVYNNVDFSKCRENGEKSDDILLGWMAYITVYLQWKYNISSKDLDNKCPARELAKLYYPLHEADLDNAADKLYKRYYGDSRLEN